MTASRFNVDVVIGSIFKGQGFDRAEQRVTKFAAAASVALAAVGVASVRQAASFDKGFRQVNTILGLTGRELAKFRSGTLDVLGSAGKTTDDLTKALFDLVSAGVPAADALTQVELASKAATAGAASLTDAVNAGISIVNAFGLAQSELSSVFDVQFATIKRGVTTFAELSQFQGLLIPQAAALGVSFQEMFGALAFLTTQGQRTQIAVGGLRALFQGLGDQADKLAESGIRVFDEFGNFRERIHVLKE